jgi:DNA-3-methyladenine glycosylase
VSPTDGLELIRRRRRGVGERDLSNGPGKLCQAMGITGALDGALMRRSGVIVGAKPKRPAGAIAVTPRIGITRAADWPLRFVLEGPASIRRP